MSYEICVLDAAIAATKEAAFDVWNDQSYWDSSAMDTDRAARKWKTKDALLRFNPALTFSEPKEPGKGFLSNLLGKKKPERRCLVLNLDAAKMDTTFDIFDQAIEINLPWDAPRNEVEGIVRDLWRHLEQLPQLGFATLYDTERDVLLNPETDFDAVVQRYIENLELDDNEKEVSTTQAAPRTRNADVSVPREHKPLPSDAPFAGNVDEVKPWWKR